MPGAEAEQCQKYLFARGCEFALRHGESHVVGLEGAAGEDFNVRAIAKLLIDSGELPRSITHPEDLYLHSGDTAKGRRGAKIEKLTGKQVLVGQKGTKKHITNRLNATWVKFYQDKGGPQFPSRENERGRAKAHPRANLGRSASWQPWGGMPIEMPRVSFELCF